MNSEEQTKKWRSQLLNWLIKRADDFKNNLRLVIIGAGLFFFGIGLILVAERSYTSSIEQELLALFGMLLAGVGASTAFVGYLGLSVLRLVKFFSEDP